MQPSSLKMKILVTRLWLPELDRLDRPAPVRGEAPTSTPMAGDLTAVLSFLSVPLGMGVSSLACSMACLNASAKGGGFFAEARLEQNLASFDDVVKERSDHVVLLAREEVAAVGPSRCVFGLGLGSLGFAVRCDICSAERPRLSVRLSSPLKDPAGVTVGADNCESAECCWSRGIGAAMLG